MTPRRAVFTGLLAALCILLTDRTVAQLRGHGGPVRALAITADGKIAISGSFARISQLSVRRRPALMPPEKKKLL